jgi:hypothetical protein
MAAYAFTSDGAVKRAADGAFIPPDPRNADYQVFLFWQAAGNTPDPYIAPAAPVPDITRRQLLLALAGANLVTADEAIAAAQTGALPAAIAAAFATLPAAEQVSAKITWASLSVAERDSPLVSLLAQSQNMTSDQVDDFFRNAATL